MIQQPLLSPEPSSKTIAFYLFINTSSGSKIGQKYLSIEAQTITFQLKSQTTIIHFYNLLHQQSRQKGLHTLSNNLNKYQNRIIICGGDGTVLWVIQEIANANISFTNLIFGVIPIGTGNDFARSLGWGGKPIEFSETNLINLKKQIVQWLVAEIKDYDIWDFELKFYEEGSMVSIEGQREVRRKLGEYKRSFSNYFGLGIDARVGFSFEKRRTKNAFTNLVCYGCIGLFKWCRSINSIEDMIENMESQTEEEEDEVFEIRGEHQKMKNVEEKEETKEETEENKAQILEQQKQQTLQQPPQQPPKQQNTSNINHSPKTKKSTIFHTNPKQHGSKLQLKQGFKNLLGLNSRSYMAGATEVWSSRKQGIVDPNRQEKFHPSDFGDGELEFCSFESQFQLGLERYVPGRASKVGQGPGPYVINFKKSEGAPIEVYFQIDGEFFKIYNPEYIKIEKTKLIEGSKIRVMMKRV